ncbi:MAG: Sir2 family NAD-dependent protein deacetylase [Pseudomonadota bacterium]
MHPVEISMGRVATWLSVARHIVVISGAGLSKASGIPTYRDSGGLWTEGSNLRFSDAAAFVTNPEGFLNFWAARRAELLRAQPNAAHRALVELQNLRPSTSLVTQNVDGLLTRAGASNVLELHGTLDNSFCTNCGARDPAQHEGYCLACNLRSRPTVRPAVVMFGEALDPKTLALAEWKCKQADVFISVGTTALVYPAAGLAERAQARGAKLVLINVEETIEDARADAVLRGGAEQMLPDLLRAMATRRSPKRMNDGLA